MHWLATKHVSGLAGTVFGMMAGLLGFVSMRSKKRGQELPGWVRPVAITVLVAGCAIMCVAQI